MSLSIPGSIEEVIADIVQAHIEGEVTRCLAIVSCTLQVYDLLTTLDQEFEYIWSIGCTIPRVVFHLNRILPAVTLAIVIPPIFMPGLAPSTCKTFVYLYSYASVLVSLNIAAIVVLRCWALYDCRKWVLRSLLITLTCAIAASVVILKWEADADKYIFNPLPEILPGCLVIYTPSAWLPYAIPLAFETLVFALMVYKSIVLAREFGSAPFIERLMIDGTMYYLVVIFSVIFCLISASIDVTRGPVISSGFLVTMLGAMCSRMIISLEIFVKQEQQLLEYFQTESYLSLV